MTDDKAAAELAAIRERVQAATPGPWWFDEDDLMWRLHGVHAVLPPFAEGFPGQVINHQILKAPKSGTPYAEYWPDAADAAFIVGARTDVPRLLAAVNGVLSLHSCLSWYAAADGCGHPEPADDMSDEWQDWDDSHQTGTTGELVCLLTKVGDCCPECTRLACGEESGDFVSAPCTTRSEVLAALTGKGGTDG